MVVVLVCGDRLGLGSVLEDKPSNVNLSSLESTLRESSGQACKKRDEWFRFSVKGLFALKSIDCIVLFIFCFVFFQILLDFTSI